MFPYSFYNLSFLRRREYVIFCLSYYLIPCTRKHLFFLKWWTPPRLQMMATKAMLQMTQRQNLHMTKTKAILQDALSVGLSWLLFFLRLCKKKKVWVLVRAGGRREGGESQKTFRCIFLWWRDFFILTNFGVWQFFFFLSWYLKNQLPFKGD